MSSSIDDILNKIKLTNMNSNHKIDIHNVYGSVIQSAIELQKEIDRYNDSSIDSKDNKRLLTIKNPERLNTNDNLIIGEWGITYGGRDLSLEEDNYCWIVTNRKSGLKGYYIVERELIQKDWLNVRWGKTPVSSKERKEVIDKKRLRDKDMIQRDMITAILRGK
jgi:hypothetical protein